MQVPYSFPASVSNTCPEKFLCMDVYVKWYLLFINLTSILLFRPCGPSKGGAKETEGITLRPECDLRLGSSWSQPFFESLLGCSRSLFFPCSSFGSSAQGEITHGLPQVSQKMIPRADQHHLHCQTHWEDSSTTPSKEQQPEESP